MASSPCRSAPQRAFPPLPGTLNQLLDIEATDLDPAPGRVNTDGNFSGETPPRRDVVDDFEMPPPMPSLPEQVDEFGWTLVAAIRDFRSRVEDVFTEHYQAMKRAEDVHKLTVAKLEAENGQLRENAGLQQTGPWLMQDLQFQAKEPIQEVKKKVKGQEATILAEITGGGAVKGKKRASAVFNNKDDDDQGLMRPGRKGPIDGQAGGGNWETFVAWVPAGAALQCPQPWKPLPSEAFAPVEQPVEVIEDLDEKKWHVLEIWETDEEELNELRKNVENFKSVVPKGDSAMSKMRSDASASLKDDIGEDIGEEPPPQRLPFMVHPHARKRILWDLFSLCLVLYDMVMIPMAMFDLPESTFILTMVWTTRIFWTLDMGASVITGIVMPNGTIVFDLKFIVKKYLKTWFLLDLFIVASDWVEFIMSKGGGKGFGKIARVFRIVRAVRLLRLVRMQSVLQAITERIQSDSLTFILQILKLSVFLVSFAHIGACIWWGIGKSVQSSTGKAWSEALASDSVSIGLRYLISLHWTLTQFSGGMEEVTPKTLEERFFVVVFWVIAFMGAATIASMMTSSLVQAHIIGGSQARQLATLRKYLNQNSISKNLSLRVQRSAKHAISGDLSPDAVDLLGVVSEQLRLEMHFEMYSELFRCHPFFDQCVQVCAQVMRRIAHQATSTLLLDSGDVLFSKGEAPSEPKMYFIFKGTLEYAAPSGETVALSERQWIAEPVLWLQWVHRGQLKALSDIKVAKLDARKFQDIMERFKEVFPSGFNPKVYAHDYAAYLNGIHDMTQVNDLVGIHQP